MTDSPTPQFQPDAPSAVTFIPCEVCAGFGYSVTPARHHVRCHNCHDHPSMYGIFDGLLLYWGTPITAAGIAERKLLRYAQTGLKLVIFIVLFIALAALGTTAYVNQRDAGDLIDIFTQSSVPMAFFWIGGIALLFMYYRLSVEHVSDETFRYSEKALNEWKELAQWKHPANRAFDGYHHVGKSYRIDMAPYFTGEALIAIESAYALARSLNHHVVTPLHILAATLESTSAKIILARLGLPRDAIMERIGTAFGKEGIEVGEGLDMGIEAKQMLFFAFEEGRQQKRKHIDVMELFVAVILRDPLAAEIFYDLEVDSSMIRACVQWIHIQKTLQEKYREWKSKAGSKPNGIMDRAMTARPSPLLQSLSSDYTAAAARGAFFPLIGRANEMDQVLRILRDRVSHVLLVGPPGGGKSTILEGLAQIMASEDVPEELQDKRFVVLDPGALIANAGGVGAVEGRMQQVIFEIARAGNIVLGIEDVHHLVNMRSGSGSEDVSGILMNAMSQGLVKVIATTTTQEYQQFIQNKGPLLRRFRVVQVNEMSREDAIQVVEAKSGSMEYKYHVFFSYAAVAATVDLSTQFIQDRYLPAKALDIAAETASAVESTKGENMIVAEDDVALVISQKANVKVTAITEDERQKLLNLEEIMHDRIIGQDEAVKAVASALRRARQGLRDKHRPIANLLFMGPTGVGKTETAKTIAEVYFGNEENMIRIDMSEYQTPQSLYKLIGGNGERGILTEAVRLKPFGLLLLDELEKAHRDVLNLFLQVMDDARLTDGTGRTIDLSNIMIIATSNAGTQAIQNGFNAGLTSDQIKQQLVDGGLSDVFAPEFLNRFDNIVVFKPLTFEEVVYIADGLLQKVAKVMLEQKGITMEIPPDAVVDIARRGFDPLFGARPLKRAIQDTVDDGLAKLMLSQQLGRRDTVILRPGGEMEVKKAERLI